MTIVDDVNELALRVAYNNFMNSPNWKLMSFEEFKAMKAEGMEFTVNDNRFRIIPHEGGFFWSNGKYEGDTFDTECEAQQDAIRWVEAREDAQGDEYEYGRYVDQKIADRLGK